MRLLLDTHIALWAIVDDPRLPGAARELIAEPANEIMVSAASVWEIAIKHAVRRKGRGAMPMSAGEARVHFYERAQYGQRGAPVNVSCAITISPTSAEPVA